MNWPIFFATLLVIVNMVGFIALFWQTMDYETRHRAQRNLIIAGWIFMAVELAAWIGMIWN